MSFRAAEASTSSGVMKHLTRRCRSACALVGLARMLARASSGTSANKVGTGPIMWSAVKRSACSDQVLTRQTGMLSLE